MRRLPPSPEEVERIEADRLVIRAQAGERSAFPELYSHWFDRVYAYLRVALNDRHEAEDAAQEVFVRVLTALPEYEVRPGAFGAWLFTIVRNYTLNHLKKHSRVDVEEPEEIDRRRENGGGAAVEVDVLDRLSDQDLMVFVERMPLAQRQVVLLRYMMDLDTNEIAEVLGRSPIAIRRLLGRAHAFLGKRLSALGRDPRTRRRARPGSRRIRTQATVVRHRKYVLTDLR